MPFFHNTVKTISRKIFIELSANTLTIPMKEIFDADSAILFERAYERGDPAILAGFSQFCRFGYV
ncbi:hypothetical protein D3C76_1647270 [compost metagenome]